MAGTGEGRLTYFLAEVVKELREKHEPRLRHVHVAALADLDQSTIYKFEKGDRWMRDPELIIAAYAELVGQRPDDIWTEAVRRWATNGSPSNVGELLAERDGDPLGPLAD